MWRMATTLATLVITIIGQHQHETAECQLTDRKRERSYPLDDCGNRHEYRDRLRAVRFYTLEWVPGNMHLGFRTTVPAPHQLCTRPEPGGRRVTPFGGSRPRNGGPGQAREVCSASRRATSNTSPS